MKTPAFFIFIAFLCLPLAAVSFAYQWVQNYSRPYIGSNIEALPNHKVALLLGAPPKLLDGSRNPYFDYRIAAAAKLYRQGKIRYIIASGGITPNTNEPDAMIAALIANGVPANRISPDYLGVRTLDSVLRARDTFDQEKYIIVSQEFHNERAVYIARSYGIEAYGYNAPDINFKKGWKIHLREYGARIKMFWDLWTNTIPKHSGDKIILPDN